MPAIRAENVYKVFGRHGSEAVAKLRDGASRDEIKSLGTAAVIDASFEVEPGEIFVVMGLSGSGKSTLIRMLNGLWRPTAGSIHIGDDEIGSVSAAQLRAIRQKRISMVFQHFALLPHKTVLQNAAYPLEIQGIGQAERETKAREALAMVGLEGWEDSIPGALSGGMRQRVGLARALAAETDILLMDEAFSALDPLIRREMQQQLLELQQRLGKTIVFITHDLNEAMFLGDRIAMMRAGRIEQIGTAEEILSNPASAYVAQFVADVDRSRVLTASAVMRTPVTTVALGSGPTVALHTLQENQIPAAFVVDRGREFAGTVTDADLIAAQQSGATDLRGIVQPDERAVHQDAYLSEIFAPAAESILPVPVVDDAGRLVGVVPRVHLLEAMALSGDSPPAPETDQEPPVSIVEGPTSDIDAEEKNA